MEIGKLSNELLEKVVIQNIKNKREEVLIGSGIGEDTAILNLGKDLCVLSTDPITGATKELGRLAIHISCNDIATSGGEPVAVLLTILAPPGTTQEEIECIMKDAGTASKEINIEIVGGHTEITDAVNRIVVNTTVIGKLDRQKLRNTDNIKVGDKILMTKYAAIEGTSIIARELEEKLTLKLAEDKIQIAKDLGDLISVVKEGKICGNIGVKYMHDITEGGVFGAVWEASKATGMGVKIKENLIPFKDVTREIGCILNVNIYRLISSGSMLIVAENEKVGEIIEALDKQNINCTIIGEIISEGILNEKDGRIDIIDPPYSDELYKVLSF